MLRRLVRYNRELSHRVERAYPRFFGFPSYADQLREWVDEVDLEGETVLEAGSVDRPFLERGERFLYHGLDIDERPDCEELYDEFLVTPLESLDRGDYALLLSMTLLEHIPDNRAAVSAMLRGLKPGGVSAHYLPSKNHPYALILRAIGPGWQRRIIALLRPESSAETGYPTFFDHCSPREMKRLFREEGFEQIDVIAYYRANDYFAFFVPAFVFVTALENVCRALSLQVFASGFLLYAELRGWMPKALASPRRGSCWRIARVVRADCAQRVPTCRAANIS